MNLNEPNIYLNDRMINSSNYLVFYMLPISFTNKKYTRFPLTVLKFLLIKSSRLGRDYKTRTNRNMKIQDAEH